MRNRALQAGCAVFAVCAPWLALAADATPARAGDNASKLKGFGLAENSGTPNFGRIILVFVLLAALAWGAAWLLRRYGAKFRVGAIAGGSPIRLVSRSSLPGGIACHVVEAQGTQVLIAASRHGISTVRLDASVSPGKESAP